MTFHYILMMQGALILCLFLQLAAWIETIPLHLLTHPRPQKKWWYSSLHHRTRDSAINIDRPGLPIIVVRKLSSVEEREVHEARHGVFVLQSILAHYANLFDLGTTVLICGQWSVSHSPINVSFSYMHVSTIHATLPHLVFRPTKRNIFVAYYAFPGETGHWRIWFLFPPSLSRRNAYNAFENC